MPLVTLTQLTRELGKSAPTVRNYIAKGMPYVTEGSRTSGQEWQFDLDDCKEWFLDYQQKLLDEKSEREADEDDDEESDALKQAKLEKIRVETQRLELRLAREQGELVPIDSVTTIVERQYAAVRAQLLALPHKLAPLLAGKTDIQEIDGLLKSYLYEALNELNTEAVTNIEEPTDAAEGEEVHNEHNENGGTVGHDGTGHSDIGNQDILPQ